MKLMPLAFVLLSSIMAAAQTAPLIRDVASFGTFTLVVKADGTVVGWGRDPDGQAARPVSANRVVLTPVTIDLPGKALQVAMGDTTQYALLEDGTVVAWGTNDEGQLGNGPMGATGELGRYPKPSITPVRVTGLNNIIQIAAGRKHAVALRKDGTVWAWGTRDDGAIGDGQPKTLRPVMAIGPTQVKGLEGITRIAATGRHNLALRSDGKVMAWGLNHDGQLGNGTRDNGWTPAEVSGLDLPAVASAKVGRIVAIAAGVASFGGNCFSGAVRDDGTVWTWGSGVSGVAGNGAENMSPDDPGGRNLLPLQVKGLTNVKALSLGFGHAAALLGDGTLRMWGHNGFGQIGGTGTEYYSRPVPVKGITGVAAVYLGSMRSFAVKADGSLWFWGFATGGQGVLGRNLRVPTLIELP
jgi:alpha-tubulin suppressor-like RCC1 family protein